jgi:hypothetical protein
MSKRPKQTNKNNYKNKPIKRIKQIKQIKRIRTNKKIYKHLKNEVEDGRKNLDQSMNMKSAIASLTSPLAHYVYIALERCLCFTTLDVAN